MSYFNFTRVSSVKIVFFKVYLINSEVSVWGFIFLCTAILISRLSPPPLSEGGSSGHIIFTTSRGGGSGHSEFLQFSCTQLMVIPAYLTT